MVRFKESSFLKFFVEHRTSANIIMLLMIIIGLLSIGKLNKQFFPDFDVEVVAVTIDWPGATAEEIDKNIIQLLEPELRPISGVKRYHPNLLRALVVHKLSFNMVMTCKKEEQILKRLYQE